jgi:hypothetical protein
MAPPPASAPGRSAGRYRESLRPAHPNAILSQWFREIADAAGLPTSVWNMDARAGGITEAFEAGAEATAVQRAATHTSPAMTARYDRKTAAAPLEVAEARKRARKAR